MARDTVKPRPDGASAPVRRVLSNIRPIVSASLSSEALNKVIEAITSGEFEPGQRISEAELARNLGISRGPLREALGRLEGRLVNRKPRIGVHVISLTRDELDSLFLTREALEGMAARLAAERMSNEEMQTYGGCWTTTRISPSWRRAKPMCSARSTRTSTSPSFAARSANGSSGC